MLPLLPMENTTSSSVAMPTTYSYSIVRYLFELGKILLPFSITTLKAKKYSIVRHLF
jgi:hypothetical protein